MASPTPTSLTGVLERIIFLNEENHYTIAELRPEAAKSAEDRVTIVGALPGVQCGETLSLTGEWTRHAQHGAQFKVTTYQSRLPSSVYGIRKYLGSGLVPGIGPVYANKIVDAFGTDTFRVLSEESAKLRSVPGIGKVRAAAIKSAWDDQRTLREVHIFLQTYGVTTAQCVRIVKKFGPTAQAIVRAEPYRLAREVDGIGFKTADRIAINLGFANDAPPRLDAGLVYALQTLEEEGHTAFPRAALIAHAAGLLETSPDRLAARLDALVARKDLVAQPAPPAPASPDDALIQLPVNARAEQRIADAIRRLTAIPTGLPAIKIDAAVQWAQQKASLEFHPLQSAALTHALAHKVSILTGGPGTGKAQPLHAGVLTPTGFRPIGSLQAGDEIVTPEGAVARVRSVHPQGRKPVYRVTFSDGRSCESCGDHLWKVWTRTSVWSPEKGKKIRSRGWRIVPLSYVRRRLVEQRTEHGRLGVPLLTPCATLPDRPLPCDPYLLGALIGDGNLGEAVLFTTTDPELRAQVAARAAEIGVRLNQVTLHGTPTISYRLVGRGKGRPNPLRTALVRLGLNVNSEAKFIPPVYLEASLDQRLELLRGLLDTDGTVDKQGNVSFTTSSPRLAKDFQRLAWSVGCLAKVGAIKKPTFSYQGTKRRGRDAYTVFVQHPDPASLFRLPRKQARTARPRPRRRLAHRLRIVAVTPLAPQKCVCISVDSASGLYITDDYVVTHNTTILRALVDILKAKKVRVTLAAPTGRAAQRLAATTGGFASTIHRLLAYDAAGGGFQHNESKPLATDFLIVDESSMLDTRLAAALLSAVPTRAHLLLVGDTDQLPSVGAGNVLKDLIQWSKGAGAGGRARSTNDASGSNPQLPPASSSPPPVSGTSGPAPSTLPPAPVPVTELRFIYRQKQESLIVTTAHAINGGDATPPPVAGEVAQAQAWSDLNFILAHSAEDALAKVVELTTAFIPRQFQWLDPVADVQVLAPMHKGVAGVANLNTQLQAALRPFKAGGSRPGTPAALKTVSGTYEVGDKLIQLRNNYDKNLFNGDIGTVVAVDAAQGTLEADFDGDRHTFERGEFGDLGLAYAISIHKSQGSEYPVVVVVLLKGHFMMLQRNLLYTALTRGRKKVFLIGEPAAYGMAVRNAESKTRCTHLREKLPSR